MAAMSDCLFCKIGSGKISSKVVLQDDEMFAFEDINPQAPVHVLVIPKRHIGGLNDSGDRALLGRLLETAALVAKKKGSPNQAIGWWPTPAGRAARRSSICMCTCWAVAR